MRSYVLAAVHVAAAFWLGCSDVLSPQRAEAPGPRPDAPVPAWQVTAITSAEPPSRPAADLSVEALLELDNTINDLMSRLSEQSDDVEAMRKLAWLYAAHGWHDRAVGPLARALELDPGHAGLQADLEREIGHVGWEESELEFLLPEAAREFAEVVEMWGHGC